VAIGFLGFLLAVGGLVQWVSRPGQEWRPWTRGEVAVQLAVFLGLVAVVGMAVWWWGGE
jgi:hypothetical protein